MQLLPYLAIRNSFADLPKSDFYNQVLDHTMSSMRENSDMLDNFSDIHPVRIEHIMRYFIFHMNLINEVSTFAFSLIMDDNDDEIVTNVQIFSIK